MKTLLYTWITDQRNINTPLNANLIKAKAVSFYESIKTQDELVSNECPVFNASSVWFDKYKKRFQLKHVYLHGEAGSADNQALPQFIVDFSSKVSEINYSPKQKWNVDETGVY